MMPINVTPKPHIDILERVLYNGVHARYIRLPLTANPGSYPTQTSSACCFLPCFLINRNGESDYAIVAALISCVFSSVVVSIYAFLSMQQAHQAGEDSKLIARNIRELRMTETAPPVQPEPLHTQEPPPSYTIAMSTTPAGPYDEERSYFDALHILQGLQGERRLAALAQSVMAVGAMLLTLAVVIPLCIPTVHTAYVGMAGAIVVALGGSIWVGKQLSLSNTTEQEAANRLYRYISLA